MPQVPNAANPIVETQKIVGYLLSATHPDGGSKAVFFKKFGFSQRMWTQLRDALIRHLQQHEYTVLETTPFGVAYEVEVLLMCPDGRTPRVRVVWFIRYGEVRPRLVTALPA